MHRRVRRVAALAGLAGGLLLMTACGLGSDPTAAARVNGETITKAELQREVSRMAESAGPQGGVPAGASPALRASMLERLITLRLMRQQAKAEGIIVGEREIDERSARIQDEAGGRDQFLRLLQDGDYTGLTFRQAVQDLILSERLGEKHVPAPTTVEQRRVRHVLADSADKAAAARQRLAGGESWEKVAAEASIDPGTRGRGGDLGFIQQGQTVPPFDQAAFSLPVNELSQPIQSQFGYHVVQVVEARSAPPTPQQAAALRQRGFSQYLQGLRQQAQVHYIGEAQPPPAVAKP
jgi:parvulin-like peptidyl-prolyl isomerase